jgi:uncharacterized membrane protein
MMRSRAKRRWPCLSSLGLASLRMALLASLEGVALATFVLQLVHYRLLPDFVRANGVPPELRTRWMIAIAAAAVAGGAGGLVAAALRPQATRAVVGLLLPSLVLCGLPALLDDRCWVDRDLPFLLTASTVTLAAERLFRLAAEAWSQRPAFEARLWERARSLWARGTSALGNGKWTARAAVVAGAVALAGYFAFYTVRSHHRMQTSILDLGLFDNLFWNALHGVPFFAPSANSRNASYLAIHAEFLLYLFLPVYALVQRAETLLVLQAVVVASGAIPLYLVAERRLGHRPAVVVALAFLLYPPLHQPVFYDFHFLTLVTPFVFWAAYFLERKKWVPFWIFAALCMLCREDVALGLVGIGLGVALSGYRPRTGAALAAAALAYVYLVKLQLMAHFGRDESFLWVYKDLVPRDDRSFLGVVKTLAVNPVYAVGTLFTEDKLRYTLQVFLPVAFLSLRRPRFWYLLFPGVFVTLLSTGYLPLVQTRFQYVTHFTPYVFLGLVAYLAVRKQEDARDRAPLFALALGTLLATAEFGALRQDSFVAGFQKIEFGWTEADATKLEDLRAIAAAIPVEASLCASEREGAHLGNRKYLFALKDDIQDADYILFSTRNLGYGRDRELLRKVLSARSYGVVDERADFVVLRKGAPADGNPAMLKRI